jgi:putative membrane-bound dehydrogenase-like protein
MSHHHHLYRPALRCSTAGGIVLLLAVVLDAVPALAAARPLAPLVAPGFTSQVVAHEPLVRNPAAMAFDARGRLFVGFGPQYRNPTPDTPGDSIVILVDSTGDGVFDTTKTFAQGFNTIQGLAWRGRDLWVANSPDLTIVRDLNGDDQADEYVLVYTDLGNLEHALNSLNWAPDGKLYMSKGNSKGLTQPGRIAPKPFRELWDVAAPPGAPDFPPPRVFTADDYQKSYHDPRDDWGRMGGFLRCDDLGANLEIVSRGFRNPWDIEFDSGFNWLGTDNDQSEGDRIFMPFFGAHFGWGHSWSAHWTGENHLPTVPISGPVFTGSGTGVTFVDTPNWPASFRGVWFINDFLHRTSYVYRPTWDGALLQPEGGKWEPFAWAGRTLFHPVDIAMGPDQALYLTGWGSTRDVRWRDGQQVNEGRVFRIVPDDLPPVNWESLKRGTPLAAWSFDELFDDLDSDLPVWQTDAANELVRRDAAAGHELKARLQAGGLPLRQETWALWTLGRTEPQNRAIDTWFGRIGHTLSENARLQSLRIVAHRVREWQPDEQLPAFVADALNAPEPRVRFQAAQALMQARQAGLVERLYDLAARETDRLVFYATWRALVELEPANALRPRVQDSRPGVRRASLLALLEQGALDVREVEPLVSDPDAATATVASTWLAKRQGNPLLVIEPHPGDFSGEVEVKVVPGLKPSIVIITTDGSEPDLALGETGSTVTLHDTTTVKAALFVDGNKIGHTLEATYRKREYTAAVADLVLEPPAGPTTVADVLPLLSTANRRRGRAVFEAVGCFACHRVDQYGGTVGPDLSAMAARGDPEDLIRSILHPNDEITEGFALLNVVMRDGTSFAGRLHDEAGDMLNLVQLDGARVALKQDEIANRESLHVSPMPPYDHVLSAKDLADLAVWLLTHGLMGPGSILESDR